jgi:cytoskeletal protein CcmA (bactofilin family)
MHKIVVALFIAIVCTATFAGAALAQESDPDEDDTFLMRVNGSATIAADEVVDAALIINGDVDVEGTVNESLVVISGTARVSGTVGSDITVVRGDLELLPGATVDDVLLIDSDIVQDPAATVNGDIEDRSGDFSLGRGFAIFSLLWWVGLLIVGVAAAIIFAWLGRAQLFGAVETIRSSFVPSLITAIVIWIVLPIVAVLILFTLVGAPLGLSILLVLLPVLFLLGLIVVGAWIGSYIIKSPTTGGAIGAAVLGVIILAVVSLIPFVAIIVALAGMLGAGALVYRTFRRTRAGIPPTVPAAAPAP